MPNDDLEPRVRALEERMKVQEGLRASQDRDLATVEARTGVILDLIRSLSTTVSEHNVRLGRLERTVLRQGEVLGKFALDTTARFEQVDRRFEQVDLRFEQVDLRFEQVDLRFDEVDRRFEHMDRRFDEQAELMSRQSELLSRIAAKVDRLAPDDN